MESVQQQQLTQLKEFILLCKETPSMLHKPELAFFKEYLESLGAKVPCIPTPDSGEPKPSGQGDQQQPTSPKEEKVPEPEPKQSESESEESEVEIDSTGVIEADTGEPLPVGDESIEVTEEMMDESNDKRMQATEAQNEGRLEESIQLWTEAIQKNPSSAVLYAKRAGILLKLNRPCAAIRDAEKALELNPDQALAYKFKGRAHRFLGQWEEAARDLSTACRIDYSDEANTWLKEVMPNAKKIQDHRRKYDRKKQEKELRERQERIKKAQEERAKAATQDTQSEAGFQDFFGGGGVPSGMASGIGEILQDPEILQAFQDPEVSAAIQDISQNPQNIAKYQSNPKIKNIMAKMAMKMGQPKP